MSSGRHSKGKTSQDTNQKPITSFFSKHSVKKVLKPNHMPKVVISISSDEDEMCDFVIKCTAKKNNTPASGHLKEGNGCETTDVPVKQETGEQSKYWKKNDHVPSCRPRNSKRKAPDAPLTRKSSRLRLKRKSNDSSVEVGHNNSGKQVDNGFVESEKSDACEPGICGTHKELNCVKVEQISASSCSQLRKCAKPMSIDDCNSNSQRNKNEMHSKRQTKMIKDDIECAKVLNSVDIDVCNSMGDDFHNSPCKPVNNEVGSAGSDGKCCPTIPKDGTAEADNEFYSKVVNECRSSFSTPIDGASVADACSTVDDCESSANNQIDEAKIPNYGAITPVGGASVAETKSVDECDSSSSTPIDGVSVADSESTVDETEEYVPYYLENFLLILNSVLELKENKTLFNQDDMLIVDKFYGLSENAQKLYIRLFQRKHRWILQSRMKYPKISEDLFPLLIELVQSQLILDKGDLTELTEILHLLPGPELRSLAKTLRVSNTQGQKSDLIEAILKHSKQKTIGSFFTKSSTDSSSVIRTKAKSLLPGCYKVEPVNRGVFLRALMLFSLTSTKNDDDSMYGNQQQLFRMLMTNIGQLVYPEYTITRQTAVFRNRQDVLWLEKSLDYEVEVSLAIERHRFEYAKEIYLEAKALYMEIQSDKKLVRREKKLPAFLRCFTPSSILMRVLSQGVEVLQKLRDYKAAVEQLRQLMSQKVYRVDYRGRWCDRLALNLDQHLKQPSKALDVIKSALNDSHIRGSHRWSLYQRARRICLSPSNQKLKERLDEFHHEPLDVVNKLTIEGRLFPREVPGRKTVFITQSSDTSLGEEEITLCGVEQLVLDHYKTNLGFTDGIHGEGSIYLTLFGLFFWDIIFTPNIPDVFYGPYQTEPLDMNTENFYKSRKESIDSLLLKIKACDVEELQNMAGETWNNHNGTLCSVVNWNRFESLQHAQSLIACMKGEFLSAVFEKFCVDLRHWHSGLPDLILWNTNESTFKISEVKGPGDRLSTKQELWLDFFFKLGCDVEVCHVVGVGARKLRPMLTS